MVLCPKYIPLLSAFLNGFCARLPGLNRLCMTEIHVARAKPAPIDPDELDRFGDHSVQGRTRKCR